MPIIYKDDIFRLREIEIPDEADIFRSITSDNRVGFYLKFIRGEIIERLKANLKEKGTTRKVYGDYSNMGACNFNPDLYSADDFRDYGIKISDPDEIILGSFHFRKEGIIYSATVERVFEERDYSKYGFDEYFTTMTMPEIIASEIRRQKKFYVHAGEEYKKLRRCYIMEEIGGEEMYEYAINSEKGEELRRRVYMR